MITSALLVLGLGTLVPTGAGAAPTTTVAGPAPRAERGVHSAVERKVVRLTNKRRAAHGCRPLRAVRTIGRAAKRHSNKMARRNELSHQLPGEPDVGARLSNAGYDGWTMWGENVAVGYPTARSVVKAWMRSPGHRRNILTCRFRHIGVGVARGHGRLWWTQDFGRR
jgi:uncharacterized protein YkwD